MRKLIGLLLAVGLVFIFSAPAPAADKSVEERVKALEESIGSWTIYGSVRMDTFYAKDDAGDAGASGGLSDVKQTVWDMQSNSRVGVKVNRGDFGGKVELGYNDKGTSGADVGQGKTPDSGAVVLRHAYATYKVGDVDLLFGQTDTIFGNMTYSNQVWGDDWDLQDWGFPDESRTPMVQIGFKGLTVQLVENNKPKIAGDDAASFEVTLPKIEAQYHLSMDKFYGDIFGGASTYKVKGAAYDKNLDSYAVGIGGGVNIDPAYCGAEVWTGRNGTQLGMFQTDAAGAQIDPLTGKITDDKDMGWAFVAGVNIQKVTLEAGYGWTQSELDESGAGKNKAQAYYLQAVIPLLAANGIKLTLIPEVGVLDLMNDANGINQGKETYFGAQWKCDFYDLLHIIEKKAGVVPGFLLYFAPSNAVPCYPSYLMSVRNNR